MNAGDSNGRCSSSDDDNIELKKEAKKTRRLLCIFGGGKERGSFRSALFICWQTESFSRGIIIHTEEVLYYVLETKRRQTTVEATKQLGICLHTAL